MKKSELINLFQTMSTIKSQGNAKFKYAILKNLTLINSEIESLKIIEDELIKIMEPYENDRSGIIRKYGKEDEQGIIQVLPNDENFAVTIEELKNLDETHKDLISKVDEKRKEYIELLDGETEEFSFHKIFLDNIPDTLKDNEMELLMKFGILD